MRFRRKNRHGLDAIEGVLDGYELPSFPHVIADALGQLSDPDVAMAEVARTLEMDPGISVRLLKLANSAATGLRNPIDNLQQVVTLLGRNQVESVLISAAAKASIPDARSPVFDTQRFWQTAAGRAVVATGISAVVEPTRQSETFTAALLQDMALPVLVDHVDGYDLLLKQWYDGDIADLAEAETERFGWNHALVGAHMGTMWEFPQHLLEAIASHHDHDLATDMVGVRLVSAWHEIDDEVGPASLIRQASSVPQLQQIDCEALITDSMQRVGEVAALFS